MMKSSWLKTKEFPHPNGCNSQLHQLLQEKKTRKILSMADLVMFVVSYL
jgi:hypothetical protein